MLEENQNGNIFLSPEEIKNISVKIDEILSKICQPSEQKHEDKNIDKIILFDDMLGNKNEIIEKLNSMFHLISNISESVNDFNYKDEINGRLHDELQKYKGGLRKEFTSPLLKGIVREYDRNIRMIHFYNSNQEFHDNESARNLLKQFEITADGLLELLNDNDIETFNVNPGDIFLPKEHRLIEVIEVEDPSKDNIIESVISCGFIDNSTGRVFRNPEVRVYKIKN